MHHPNNNNGNINNLNANMNMNVNNINPVGQPSQRPGGARPITLSDIYAMNPQYVQQYLAVRGISPNIIGHGQGRPMLGAGGGVQQQPFYMLPNQAQMLAQQMNNNPGLMQMNTPLISSQPTSQPQYTPQQQQMQQRFFQQQQMPQQQMQQMSQQQPQQAMHIRPPPQKPQGSPPIPSGPPLSMNSAQMNYIRQQMRPSSGMMMQQPIPMFNRAGGPTRYRPTQMMRPGIPQKVSPNRTQQNRPTEPPTFAKIPSELNEHSRIIRARVLESMTEDHKALSAPAFHPFKGKADALNRLLPYHVLQLPEYPPKNGLTEEKRKKTVESANEAMDRISTLIEQNSKLVNVAVYEKQINKLLEIDGL